MKKNYVLEFLRFIFCILVICVHTYNFSPDDIHKYPFCGGYIAVEFFFIVSGYFIMKRICGAKTVKNDKEFGKTAITYAANKVVKLFPYMFISVILFYLMKLINNNIDITHFKYSIFEFTGLSMFGFNSNFQVTPLWFVSSLFIGSTILIYVALKNKDLFSNILIYFIPLFIYGYLYRNFGHLDLWDTLVLKSNFLLISNLRAIAALCIGCIAYKFSTAIVDINFTKIGKILITFLEIFCFTLVIIIAYNKYHSNNDYFSVILLLIGISLILSEKSYIIDIFYPFRKILVFLGNISMPIYVSHWCVRYFVEVLFIRYSYNQKVIICIMLSLIVGIALYYFVKFILSLKTKFKTIFIR